ncbi:MAG: NfeD family protein [Clostridia bacterium]|nr:NfeD family protein [Clostridia bacterium]
MDILGFTINMAFIWIGVAVLFAIIEAATMGLTTIWFSAGGVVACIASILGAPVSVQIIVFIVSSILLLYFTKPLAEKKLKIGSEKTNVEALAGQIGIVTEDITPHSTGQVKINGQIWTAIADRQEVTIFQETEVKILRVEGVKLIVTPIKE